MTVFAFLPLSLCFQSGISLCWRGVRKRWVLKFVMPHSLPAGERQKKRAIMYNFITLNVR
ncbi:hypothetical protein ACUY4R_004588 [Kosakonia sp. BK9b]